MPDLNLIKQVEQGVRDGAGVCEGAAGNPAGRARDGEPRRWVVSAGV